MYRTIVEPPDDWNEESYLEENPDVLESVKKGAFSSGWDHYVQYGFNEYRGGLPSGYESSPFTRHCRAPWSSVVWMPDLSVSPCIMGVAVESWEPGVRSLHDVRIGRTWQQLRERLWRGALDGPCADCHLAASVPVKTLPPQHSIGGILPLEYLQLDVAPEAYPEVVEELKQLPGNTYVVLTFNAHTRASSA